MMRLGSNEDRVLQLSQDTKRSRLSDVGQRTIIQMVPRLTDEPNGVADHAFALSRAFRMYGLDSIFLAATPSAKERAGEDEWGTVSLPKRQARSLAETIKSTADSSKVAAVLLHMSGYGYAKRGAPAWLLQGLRRWQLRYANQLPLITIFHELYAVGRRPWQSSFWLSPVQKVITRSILDLSSDAIVTTQLFRDQLLRWNPAARVTCMPVFSNVGEPDHCAPPNARCAIGVVFGLAGVEDRLFGYFRRDIERVITTIGIEKIIDIGPRSYAVPVSFAGVPVISKGALPAFAVSSLLEQAKFGFVAYPFDVLAKSGVFAAYAAHGTIPIVFADRRGSFDGLEDGRHFLDGVKLNATVHPDRLTLVQRQLSGWYRAHSLQVQAHHLYQCATNSTGLQASPVVSRSLASRQ